MAEAEPVAVRLRPRGSEAILAARRMRESVKVLPTSRDIGAMAAAYLRAFARSWRAVVDARGASDDESLETLLASIESAARALESQQEFEPRAGPATRPRAAPGQMSVFLDAIRDYALILLAEDGTVRFWNAGAENIFGLSRAAAVGTNVASLYTPDALVSGKPQEELAMAKTEGRFCIEDWRRRSDGSRFWAGSATTVVAFADEPHGFAVVIQDFTNQRHAVESLRRSEERFRVMVEAVRDYAIFMLDTEGRITSWNTGAENIKGYRADEIIGSHFSRFYTPEDLAAQKPERELQVAQTVGRYEEEGWRVRKDGSRFWASVVLTAIRDDAGRLLGYTKVTRDVTERMQHFEALRQSEERFRLMVDSVRDYALFMLDPTGHITSWNTGAENIKGYRADEIIGSHFSRFYGEDDIAAHKPERELAIAASSGRYEEEGWRIRKDGSRFWANVVLSAMRDSQGRLVGFAKVTRDMTEKRKTETALLKATEELETRVRERTAALEAANAELEAFSYSVSHDLRAPLRALDGFSEILLEELATSLEPRHADYLQRIRAAAKRMSHLIDSMLRLSRLLKMPIAITEVDVSRLCQQIAAELRQVEPARKVELKCRAGLVVRSDPQLMRTVLENLMANAWKFTRPRETAVIEIGMTPEGNELFVRDNGVGFDPALKGKLFLPFQRLHRESEFEGTGVGLATVKRILDRLGGHIVAESDATGAVFRFSWGSQP